MIGSLIGAGISAAGGILGGLSASKAIKKYRQGLQRQAKENEDWYDRNYNADATQRADAQRILQMTADRLKQRNKAAQGRAAVMGASGERVATEQEANAQAMADAAAQVAVQGERRKDAVQERYLQRKQQVDDALNQANMQKAAAIGQAVQGVTVAAGDIADALDEQERLKRLGEKA